MTSTTQKTIILKRCGPCLDFASLTLAFALQLRKPRKNLSQGSQGMIQGSPHMIYDRYLQMLQFPYNYFVFPLPVISPTVHIIRGG